MYCVRAIRGDKQAGVGWDDKLVFFESLVNDMVWQFTPLGFAFVVLGFIAMSRSRYNWLWLSLTVSWFMSSLLLVILLDFKAEFIWLSAFRGVSPFSLWDYGYMVGVGRRLVY